MKIGVLWFNPAKPKALKATHNIPCCKGGKKPYTQQKSKVTIIRIRLLGYFSVVKIIKYLNLVEADVSEKQ